ncbi:putative lipoprotein [Pseudooceanicola batsensis HTCC2597]|uniref:Putative lipoprotein n=1 Tax=Pseudooceanicola batsensis (strain ATCC BAA-863 / DSM 15984 / KCTC 12145 / HTCC2597) TaxID=252305 RepID=A3TVR3_PSEBH|nr:VacJ family lipoprotein [Pseudooceanicola batsensis]EAQ03709.1 putative lipoprotein [Pseudooceanicola batsensis HTCC2597]
MSTSIKSYAARFVLLGAVGAMTACSPAPPATGINDPWEASNRRMHAFNKSVDRNILGPAGGSYVTVLPEPVVTTVGNFAGNLATPSVVVNNVLQADARGAFTNSFRFVLNTTLGMGGLFDVATMAGINEVETDFGETLHVWGAGEGNYVELPVLGPSTERDAVGRIVDLFTNPLGYVLSEPEKYAGPVASVAKRLGDRGRYSQTVGSVLHESADSYAQGRSTYLQNRRYQLGGGAAATGDPYDDPYAATGDPYDDPYLQ